MTSNVTRFGTTSITPETMQRNVSRRLPGVMASIVLGAIGTSAAFAGGVDVSTDEIYTDGVTLTDWEGNPLDINGDGHTDLIVAGNRIGAGDASRYYLGNGDGTFTSPVLLDEGPTAIIIAADLNNDTFLDLVQVRRDLTNLLYFGDGAGGFGDSVELSADMNRSLSIAVGDLDNDDDIDIVIGNGRPGGNDANPPQPNRVYLNEAVPSGTATFVGADISADLDVARSIALADIDDDGDLDVIAVSDTSTASGSFIVYLNDFAATSTVTFAAGEDFGPNAQTTKILVGDLDGDGISDLVTLNFGSVNQYFLNTSASGVLTLGPAADITADIDNTNGGVLADFDGDGDLDLAVANFWTSSGTRSSRNRLYLNEFIPDGNPGFAPALDISADEHMTHQLAAGDINDYDHIDIVAGNQDDFVGGGNLIAGFDRRYLNNGTADPFTNVAPVIDAQAGVLQTDVDTDLTILIGNVTVTDPDNAFPADFTLTVQPGDNYTVTDHTITPAAAFTGDLTVPVVLNDGTDDSAPFDLTVTVGGHPPANNAPTFTSTAVTDAEAGSAYTYDITAADADVADTLVITAPTLPAWLQFADNGDGTASLSGTPATADAGDHAVSLQVSDGTDTAVQNFTITVSVEPTPGNNAPTFTSTAVVDAEAGTDYTYDITATDADVADTLVITAPTLPAWLQFADNGNGTASLSGTPAAADAGDHAVSLQVSDGTDTAVQNFTIAVSDEPAPANNAPTFTSTAVIDAEVGTTYTYDITTSDADVGDALVVTAPTLPAWLELMENGDGTATLTGLPAAADVGDHEVSLQVSDGTDTAVQDFTITVEAAVAQPTPPPPSGGGGGGGSFGMMSLFALCAAGAFRRRQRRTM